MRKLIYNNNLWDELSSKGVFGALNMIGKAQPPKKAISPLTAGAPSQ